MWADRMVDSAIAHQIIDSGLATVADLQSIREAWREWAAADDGWFSVLHGELLYRLA